jgi:hypothetical protein
MPTSFVFLSTLCLYSSMSAERTIFEQAMADYATWSGEGEAPAYPLYTGDVVALVAKVPKFVGEVVVFPSTGYPGQDVGLFDLDTHVRLGVELVAHTIGQKMMRAFGVDKKVIEHDEGFGVPNHPHAVVFAAQRGEGARLYELSRLNPDQVYFELVQEMLALDERTTRLVDEKLGVLTQNAALLDAS